MIWEYLLQKHGVIVHRDPDVIIIRMLILLLIIYMIAMIIKKKNNAMTRIIKTRKIIRMIKKNVIKKLFGPNSHNYLQ